MSKGTFDIVPAVRIVWVTHCRSLLVQLWWGNWVIHLWVYKNKRYRHSREQKWFKIT